jgi:hypothetical protein
MVNIYRRLSCTGAVLLSSLVAGLASHGAHATCQPPAAWSSTSTYNIGAVVSFDVLSSSGALSGAFYQSLVNNNLSNAPASSPGQWTSNNILVCKFTVQPIDVCTKNSAGQPTGCAVINNLKQPSGTVGQTAASNPGTNLIGFIDPLTGMNAEQQAFAQIGVSMAFAPVVAYISPQNPNSTNPPLEPDYRWLHVRNCSTCTTGSTSPDLLTLTQQGPSPPTPLSQGGTPLPPLNPDQTIPNLFFVKVIHPATSGVIIKGFSWDFNNGGAIASDSVFAAPLGVGTVAHEVGHMTGWEHTTFFAGPLTCPLPYGTQGSFCPENLMSAGSAPRQVPSGLINTANNCSGARVGQACWVPQIAPNNTTQPVALDLLTTGGVGQCSVASLSQCQSQQAVTLLSNFVYPIPSTVSTATQSGTGTATTLAVSQTTTKNSGTGASAQGSTSSSGNPIIFNVSGLSGGSPGETLLAYVVIMQQPPAGSPQFTFSRNPFKMFPPPLTSRSNLLQDFDLQPLDGDVPYPPCSATGVLCGEVEFNRNAGQGFGENDFMQFSLNILKGGAPATLADVCGAKVAFVFSDGYAPVSVLGSPPCSGSSSLMATSLSQDPTTPPQVVTVSTAVGPGTTPGCTQLPNGQCLLNPITSGVTDSNPATGVESSGPICYSHGSPVPCP